MEPVEPVQMNIYWCNTYEIDFRWLHFNEELRVQEKPRVKEEQFSISIFVTYRTIPIRGISPEIATIYLSRSRATSGQKKIHRTNQGSNFLGGSFSNRDNAGVPIQLRREIQHKSLKDDFSSRTDPSIFFSFLFLLIFFFFLL